MTLTKQDVQKIIANPSKEYNEAMVYSDFMNTVEDMPKLEILKMDIPGIQTEYVFSEFTSKCKKQKNPDHGTITVRVWPKHGEGRGTIEMQSLKHYLVGYRDFDIFQEETCFNVFIDVIRTCWPHACEVIGNFTPRGATATNVIISYKEAIV